jgi:hypothetical protein
MMHAADNPWQMRPAMRKAGASAPEGAKPTSRAPAMPSRKPHCTTLTRPARSATPPSTTMKMPEKRAVMDTAMFITLVGTPRSADIAGEMLSTVCANSQKASTPRIMPNSRRSLPV